ncbi:single-stranded DNA-binding protein [Acidaminobacter hydrogenoformans]|uniref:Single-stranded DNA-binding protein n=1 Tax=Acidaminobacter hydrogenoformans DSM 2784 TaxID=1120920 RepID=A0A1G5RRY9_9FIRM|nr:single-stranded DNA-binding protein [Acidaminobacter hydrogenoformans]SCZ76618.1 single-strand DNA-binding protein [Acidaminobacter hydrogenoformans DSM 2784]
MNHVVLIGRLVRDPELRHIASTGRAVANFTIAVDRNLSRDKKAEYQQKGIPTADFIRVNVWGRQAETSAQYLAKGRMVAVEGAITTGSFKTNTGETRYTTEVTANHVEFLERSDSPGRSGSYSDPSMEYDPGDFSNASADLDDDEVPF